MMLPRVETPVKSLAAEDKSKQRFLLLSITLENFCSYYMFLGPAPTQIEKQSSYQGRNERYYVETFTIDEGLGPEIRIVPFINVVGDHEHVGKHDVACCVSCRQSRSGHFAKTAIGHNHSHQVVAME